MAPLRGIYLEYYIGIGKYVTASLPQAEFDKLEGAEKFERVLLKEPIGEFLNLTLAPPRFGVFNPASSATNKGRNFAYRKQKGSRTFKVGLRPGTVIPQRYGERSPGGQLSIVTDNTRTPAEFQMSLPRTCSVSEVIQWLLNGTTVDLEGNATDTVTSSSGSGGGSGSNPFQQLTYLITPAGRKHPLRGLFEGAELPEPKGVIKSDTWAFLASA